MNKKTKIEIPAGMKTHGHLSLEELAVKLKEAVAKQQYETAAKFRDLKEFKEQIIFDTYKPFPLDKLYKEYNKALDLKDHISASNIKKVIDYKFKQKLVKQLHDSVDAAFQTCYDLKEINKIYIRIMNAVNPQALIRTIF